MKRILAMLLTILLVLGLCACGGNGGNGSTEETQGKTQGLQVGYGRADILPTGQVNMSGYGNQGHRISEGYLDFLYATCLAARDGDETILFYSTDTLSAQKAWTLEARQLINQATGVPEANIQIGGTHTHSSGAVGGKEPLTLQWKQVYMDALVNSAKQAIADLTPTELYGTKVQTEGLTFVRHLIASDDTVAGDNFGNHTIGYKGYATEPDEEMILVKFDREGDKKDILLMNFQFHPCFTGGSAKTDLSADAIASIRDNIEKDTGMNFIYFTGSAGNQNATTRIVADRHAFTTKETYGAELARIAKEALPTITTKIEGSGVACSQQMMEYASNKYGQERLAEAQEVYNVYKSTGDSTIANAKAVEKGFFSWTQCQGIVQCSSFPATQSMELNVVRIGGLGMVAAPYEMFSDNAKYIKANSPFEFTVISGVTNAYNGYFPTKAAYEYGCYESYNARFAPGIAEDTASKFVEMLNSIK